MNIAPEKLNKYLDVSLLIFTAAFFLRLVLILQTLHQPYFNYLALDPAYYDKWARYIAAGNWLGGTRLFDMTPLFAYFLAGIYKFFGPDLVLVKLIQAVFGSLNCVLIYLIAKNVFRRSVGVAAGFMAAAYGFFVFNDCVLEKTFLTTFLSSLSCYLLVLFQKDGRAGFLFWAGIALGLIGLDQPNLLAVLPFCLVWLKTVIPDIRVFSRRALVFLSGFLLMTLPVVGRNYFVTKELAPATASWGSTFFSGNNPDAGGEYTPPGAVRTDAQYEAEDFRVLARKMTGKDLTALEASRFWFGKGMDFIFRDPLKEGWVIVKKFQKFFNWYEIPDNHDYQFSRDNFPTVLGWPLLSFGIICPLAIVGMGINIYRRKFYLPAYFIVGYLSSILIFYVYSRFRAPAVSFFMIYAAFAALWLREKISRRDWRKAAAAIVVLVIAGFLVNSGAPDNKRLARSYNVLGNAYDQQGDAVKAVEAYRNSILMDGQRAGTYYNLGNSYLKLGLYQEAAAAYERALFIDSAYYDVYNSLALAYLAQNNGRKAVEVLQGAVKVNPADAAAYNNLGVVYCREKDHVNATKFFDRAAQLGYKVNQAALSECAVKKE